MNPPPNEPYVFLSWWQSPTGFWLPPSEQGRTGQTDLNEIPVELRPRQLPMIIRKAPPPPAERLLAYLDEPSVDMPVSTRNDLLELARGIGFEHGIRLLAQLSARIVAAGASRSEQVALAQDVYGDSDLMRRIHETIGVNQHLLVFSEQLVYLLMRVILQESPESPFDKPMPEVELNRLRRAVLAASGVAGSHTNRGIDAADPRNWIGLLVQHGEYQSTEDFLLAHTREIMLLDHAAGLNPNTVNYCELEEWHVEATGLTIAEQSRLGFVLASIAHAFEESRTAGLKTTLAPDDVMKAILIAGLKDKHQVALNAISADREEFKMRFVDLANGVPDTDSLLWESRPWEQKPFLRLRNGGLILLSPRFVKSWMSRGFYFRALAHAGAKDRRTSLRLTRFYGKLFEDHCLARAEEAFADKPDVPVRGDNNYSNGQGRTPDITIEIGQDLVLIEVTHSSLSANTLLRGDLNSTVKELRDKLTEKANQLGDNILRMLNGDAVYPSDPGTFTRVWPIVVSGAVPLQTPHLWDFFEQEFASVKDARVQPLTMLDPTEYETLMGLVEAGHSLVSMLTHKTAEPFRKSDFTWWRFFDVQAPNSAARPKSMEARQKSEFEGLLEIARPNFDPEPST